MRPITSEWVAKAESDLVTAERVLRAEHFPNYDAARAVATARKVRSLARASLGIAP